MCEGCRAGSRSGNGWGGARAGRKGCSVSTARGPMPRLGEGARGRGGEAPAAPSAPAAAPCAAGWGSGGGEEEEGAMVAPVAARAKCTVVLPPLEEVAERGKRGVRKLLTGCRESVSSLTLPLSSPPNPPALPREGTGATAAAAAAAARTSACAARAAAASAEITAPSRGLWSPRPSASHFSLCCCARALG